MLRIDRVELVVIAFAVALMVGADPRQTTGGDATGVRPAGLRADIGTVEGTVIYRGDTHHTWRLARYYVKHPKTGQLGEAVVALNGPDIKRSPPVRPSVVVVDQKEMRFEPETVAIRAGDRVKFTNSDPQTHNISTSDPRRTFSDTLAQGQTAFESFPRASGIRLPFALGCKLHSQMQGWIYVFDHPFFQVTGVDGRFRIENVPQGKYRLDVAHAAGALRASRMIHVKANETVKLEFLLGPQDRSAQD
jgi:plastocyanin